MQRNTRRSLERIWLTSSVEPLGEVVITIRDTGKGIPADKLESIFEMFTQLDGQGGRTHSGLGIGLTLVKSLIQMHGGTIKVQSEGVNQGSAFIVRLPSYKSSRTVQPQTLGSRR